MSKDIETEYNEIKIIFDEISIKFADRIDQNLKFYESLYHNFKEEVTKLQDFLGAIKQLK